MKPLVRHCLCIFFCEIRRRLVMKMSGCRRNWSFDGFGRQRKRELAERGAAGGMFGFISRARSASLSAPFWVEGRKTARSRGLFPGMVVV
jgi:hypothetical protein